MRVLLCIGCNVYDQANQLHGAEKDAVRMFNALLDEAKGNYDKVRSKLLTSPTLTEVREAVLGTLFGAQERADTFTFFFAGHGAVSSSTFYMWVRDTKPHAQSMTALSLTEIFRSIGESAPSQSNIIIDACESGGLIKDLKSLLSTDGMGQAHSPGVSLVATSAMDQYSGETDEGGFGTNAILDCIEGRAFVHDRRSTLDLVEIGRHVSENYSWPDQQPVVWGINLLDIPRFCVNPRYSADPSRPMRDVLQSWPSAAEQITKNRYEALWKLYRAANEDFEAREFSAEISKLFSEFAKDTATLARVARQLVDPVKNRAREAKDAFRPVQVTAAVTVSLLPYLHGKEVASVASDMLMDLVADVCDAADHLIEDLEANRYALLSRGGLSDLFYLPIRISSVLAWIGAAHIIGRNHGSLGKRTAKLFVTAIRILLDVYGASFRPVSDGQCSSWVVVIKTAINLGLMDEAEQIAATLFNDLVHSRGKVARSDISPDKVFDFMCAKAANDFDGQTQLVEQPMETLTALFLFADQLNLAEVWDTSLWKLDGIHFSAYLPERFTEFNAAVIDGGLNGTWAVGFDVFRVGDFISSWPKALSLPSSDVEAGLSILSSLLFPDRTPWFIVQNAGPLVLKDRNSFD